MNHPDHHFVNTLYRLHPYLYLQYYGSLIVFVIVISHTVMYILFHIDACWNRLPPKPERIYTCYSCIIAFLKSYSMSNYLRRNSIRKRERNQNQNSTTCAVVITVRWENGNDKDIYMYIFRYILQEMSFSVELSVRSDSNYSNRSMGGKLHRCGPKIDAI